MAFDVLQIKFLEITPIYDAKLMFRLYFSHYVINIHFSLNEIGHKLDYFQKMSLLWTIYDTKCCYFRNVKSFNFFSEGLKILYMSFDGAERCMVFHYTGQECKNRKNKT